MAGAFSKLASDQDPPGVVPGFLRPIDTKAVAKELKLLESIRPVTAALLKA